MTEEEVSEATSQADEESAQRQHTSDREPTPDEERAAEKSEEAYAGDSETVAEHEAEMAKKGADAKGEGQID